MDEVREPPYAAKFISFPREKGEPQECKTLFYITLREVERAPGELFRRFLPWWEGEGACSTRGIADGGLAAAGILSA
jgi:hypothetical protein